MKQRIAVAGAGPVGLTVALCLARAGHEVRVFEKRAALNTASRASTFHPPTLDMLARLGVLGPLESQGVRVNEIRYYRCNIGRSELAARFPYALLEGAARHPWRMHLEQSRLTPALLAALETEPDARVEFNAAVEGFTEHAGAIDAPLLALVAAQDTLIPPDHAKRLFDAWRGPKSWQLIPHADHNSIDGDPAYWSGIAAFLAALKPG
jgi:2-polyprenyl-6-methoxyphenol hydroxylase-like FAD-dependent oxidoreductase